MLVTPDQDVVVTNDGATILEKMEVQHPVAKLLVELSKSQDDEIGDGTTSVVVLAGSLLEQASLLIDKGLHPLQIADGFEKACTMAVAELERISEPLDIKSKQGEPPENLIRAAMISLGSKIISKGHNMCRKIATISVKAVLQVADLERKDVNFDMIKLAGKTGASLEETELIDGLLIDKEISHPQMPKEIKDAKICILTCPFEPPKPQTKTDLRLMSADDYKKMHAQEQKYFKDMVQKVKDSGANIAMCQWGFDDEANHLLILNDLLAVRWVAGGDVELLAMATGGRIIPRFKEISKEKLGQAGLIKELSFGTNQEKMLVIKDCQKSKVVTILVRGSSRMIVAEAKRAIHDSLCVVRNLIKDNMIVYGGGSAEIACYLAIHKQADKISTVDQYAVRAFADALEQIPVALADNSGLDPLSTVAAVKAKQIQDKNPNFGVDCNNLDFN